MRICLPILILLASFAVRSLGQTPNSDSQAVALLQQVFSTSGMAANPFENFTAQGTITYYWAGQPVHGTATIRARGHDQFRLDASLPDGTLSFSTNERGGQPEAARW